MIEPCAVSDAGADWLTAAAPAVRDLGWDRLLRTDVLGEGIAIAQLDVVPPHDVRFETEGPPTFSISLFLDGQGSLSIDDGLPLPVEAGMAVVCYTDQVVHGTNTVRGGGRIRVVDVRFDTALLASLGGPLWGNYGGGLLVDRSVAARGAVLIGFPATPGLLLCGRQILECPYQQAGVRQLYLRAKALEILAMVVAVFSETAETSSSSPARNRRKIAEAQRLLEERMQEPWTIARLARTVSLNEKSLKSGFRYVVGQSIHAYLIKVRMDAAASLLAAGHPVTEAAFATGFTNLSHFSKTFRRATGVSPRVFAQRRQIADTAN